MKINDALLNLRKTKGLTQREMADKLNKINDEGVEVSKSAISRWENGTIPSASSLALYAKAFNIDMNYLLGLTDVYSEANAVQSHTYILTPDIASAGAISYSESYNEAEHIELSDSVVGKYAGRKDLEFTKINGNSMNNIIPDGSFVGYIRDVEWMNLKGGDIVIYRYSSDYGIKRFYDTGDTVMLKYDSSDEELNGKYLVYTKDEYLQIVGKVVLYLVEVE